MPVVIHQHGASTTYTKTKYMISPGGKQKGKLYVLRPTASLYICESFLFPQLLDKSRYAWRLCRRTNIGVRRLLLLVGFSWVFLISLQLRWLKVMDLLRQEKPGEGQKLETTVDLFLTNGSNMRGKKVLLPLIMVPARGLRHVTMFLLFRGSNVPPMQHLIYVWGQRPLQISIT